MPVSDEHVQQRQTFGVTASQTRIELHDAGALLEGFLQVGVQAGNEALHQRVNG
jgi:hypothetical protein